MVITIMIMIATLRRIGIIIRKTILIIIILVRTVKTITVVLIIVP